MGLLKVGLSAAGSVLADQWREYFYCPALEADVLARKGVKRSGGRNYNTKGSDNIISNGSIIAVNEGQCMIIVDQGAVAEVCAEAGEFVFDTSAEPSIFYGDLKKGIADSFQTFGKRFTLAGDTGKDQRIYFFNTKEIIGNKYGTASPVPFRVVDANIGLDMDIAIRCHGEYAYKMVDPILFYKNLCGNVEEDFTRDKIDSQLKSELLTALQPAFAKVSAMGVRYSALPGHTMEMADALNEILSEKWGGRYGLEISAFGVNSVKASDEDEATIKELQKMAVYRNPNMAAAQLAGAQAEAMKAAAANTSTGPMMAFAGMNMAAGAGGMNAKDLFAMGQQPQFMGQQSQFMGQQAQAGAQFAGQNPAGGEGKRQAAKDAWTCSCGTAGNTGKFCVECGKPKPEEAGFWTCSCGTKNKGKFCMECGAKKPAGVPQYRCDKCGWEPADPTKPPKFCPECGWEPADPTKPPKFCPECGDPFDDGDIRGRDGEN